MICVRSAKICVLIDTELSPLRAVSQAPGAWRLSPTWNPWAECPVSGPGKKARLTSSHDSENLDRPRLRRRVLRRPARQPRPFSDRLHQCRQPMPLQRQREIGQHGALQGRQERRQRR